MDDQNAPDRLYRSHGGTAYIRKDFHDRVADERDGARAERDRWKQQSYRRASLTDEQRTLVRRYREALSGIAEDETVKLPNTMRRIARAALTEGEQPAGATAPLISEGALAAYLLLAELPSGGGGGHAHLTPEQADAVAAQLARWRPDLVAGEHPAGEVDPEAAAQLWRETHPAAHDWERVRRSEDPGSGDRALWRCPTCSCVSWADSPDGPDPLDPDAPCLPAAGVQSTTETATDHEYNLVVNAVIDANREAAPATPESEGNDA